jgi:hypothetical protein
MQILLYYKTSELVHKKLDMFGETIRAKGYAQDDELD